MTTLGETSITTLPLESTSLGSTLDGPGDAGTTTGGGMTDTTGTDTNTDGTTGVESCVPECPLLWICSPPDCINPDEGQLCINSGDCGALAPICGPDDLCHDGSEGDACANDLHCAAMLLCGPVNACQDGNEGDPCQGPEHCGAAAPHCPSIDGECHDGSFGDPCDNEDQCMSFCVGFYCV